MPFPQKAKPLSLEESFKLLQDQEKRQKVGTYTHCHSPQKSSWHIFDILWTTKLSEMGSTWCDQSKCQRCGNGIGTCEHEVSGWGMLIFLKISTPTHITQWTPPCIVIDQTKEKLLESCQNWNWNFNFLSDLLFMKSTWIPLQDLQAQHATQKLREQSSLAKTDYTTHQVLNHLQYPCYKLLSCKISYNILNLLAEETSRIHSHMPKLKRTKSFLQVASQG